jgi:DNA invertase Pin-like site-specific DNA recombinase
MTKAALWLRVSTSQQETDNQLPDIERFCAAHGHEIVRRFEVEDSAWNGGKPNGRYRETLTEALDGAWRGEFSVLVVWALDRLSRGGAEDTLRLIRLLRERGCALVSIQEPWLVTMGEMAEPLIGFAGWIAKMESARRSERIKAGLARRAAKGGHIGRKPGSKDLRQRKRSGYVARYERERDQRQP